MPSNRQKTRQSSSIISYRIQLGVIIDIILYIHTYTHTHTHTHTHIYIYLSSDFSCRIFWKKYILLIHWSHIEAQSKIHGSGVSPSPGELNTVVCSTGVPPGLKDVILWGSSWLTALNCHLSPEIVSVEDSFLPQAAPPSQGQPAFSDNQCKNIKIKFPC